MEDLRRHCSRALLLERGRVERIGSVEDVAEGYAEMNKRETERERRGLADSEPDARSHRASIDLAGSRDLPAECPRRQPPAAAGTDLQHGCDRLPPQVQQLGAGLPVVGDAAGAAFPVLYSIFRHVAQVGGIPHYAAYLATAIVLWTFFAEVVSTGVTSLSQNGPLLRKVRFPRFAIPFSYSTSSLINLAANSVLVVIVLAVSGVTPRMSWLQMPLLVALLALFALGMATAFSALYPRYRDMRQLWQVLSQLFFFASPIIYVAKQYPDALEPVLSANPLAAILTQMRHALIDPSAPTAAEQLGGTSEVLVPLAVIFVTLALGLWLFNREAPLVAERA